MNDEQGPTEDPQLESQMSELFAPLRGIEPPPDARLANRIAVTAALSSLREENTRQPAAWWQRSLSIPLPLAAAATLLLTLGLPASYFIGQSSAQVVEPTVNAAITRLAVHSRGEPAPWKQYQVDTYLCGVGCLNSQTRYFSEDQNP